jgi:hypothetical protein
VAAAPQTLLVFIPAWPCAVNVARTSEDIIALFSIERVGYFSPDWTSCACITLEHFVTGESVFGGPPPRITIGDFAACGNFTSPLANAGSTLAGCSETGTTRVPLGERLEKCFRIVFGCTRTPRLDGAIAAKNYRYVRKAEPGRRIDCRLGASGHSCMWGAPRIEMEGSAMGRLCSSRSLVRNFIQTPRLTSAPEEHRGAHAPPIVE